MSDKLERVQRQAMRIIFGQQVDYDTLLNNGTIETLKSRRDSATLRFALKESLGGKHKDRWFPRNEAERDTRESTRRPFAERHHKTEKSRINPIQHMIRALNDHYTK